MAKEAEGDREKLNKDLKAEIQASEACVLAQVELVRATIDHLGSFTFIFPLDPFHIDVEPADSSPDTSSSPPIDEAAIFMHIIS